MNEIVKMISKKVTSSGAVLAVIYLISKATSEINCEPKDIVTFQAAIFQIIIIFSAIVHIFPMENSNSQKEETSKLLWSNVIFVKCGMFSFFPWVCAFLFCLYFSMCECGGGVVDNQLCFYVVGSLDLILLFVVFQILTAPIPSPKATGKGGNINGK